MFLENDSLEGHVAQQSNIADQIGEAVQDALEHQDFSKIQNVVLQGLGAAARGVGAGIATAANTTRQAYEDYQRGQQERLYQNNYRQELARVAPTRFANMRSSKTGGYVLAIVGGLFAATFGLGAISTLVAAIAEASAGAGAICAVLAGLTGVFLGVSVYGGKRVGLITRFEKYRNAIGLYEAYPVPELANNTGSTPEAVARDVDEMVNQKMFLQGHVDPSTGTLFVTDASYNNFRQNQQQAAEQQHQEQLRQQVAQQQQAPERPLTKQEQQTLDTGKELLQQIEAIRPSVKSDKVAAQARQISALVGTIFKRAEEDPDVIADLQQTVDYYLPLTVKLLNTYAELAGQPLQSESITASRNEIEQTLDTLIGAFGKLHDSLFRDISWDVSTDITVLNAMLAQDGLTEDPFEKKDGRTS